MAIGEPGGYEEKLFDKEPVNDQARLESLKSLRDWLTTEHKVFSGKIERIKQEIENLREATNAGVDQHANIDNYDTIKTLLQEMASLDDYAKAIQLRALEADNEIQALETKISPE